MRGGVPARRSSVAMEHFGARTLGRKFPGANAARVAVVVPASVSVPLSPEARKEDSSAALKLDCRAGTDAAAAALTVTVEVTVLLRPEEALAAEAEAALAALADEADALTDSLAKAIEYGNVVWTAVNVARRDVVPVNG